MAFGSYRSKTLKLVLNGQNFAIPWPKIRHVRIFRNIEYDFLKEIRKIHSGVWKLRPKTFKTVNFGLKMAKFWPQMAKFWPSQNFFLHIHYDFLKEDHKGSSIQKLWKFIAAYGRYRPKTLKNCYFGQKWSFFIIFGHFGGHLSHMETQLHAKNQKKISNGLGCCRTGTDARTHGRTRVNL